MAVLLEFKEKFRRFYNKYDTYLVPALKFIVALVSFIMLNASIGYMEKLNNPVIAILISVICAFLPVGFTIVMLSLFMVAHLYAISVEFALIALCVVLLMYLLYFRFASKSGYLLILTVFMCWIKMPFVLPVAVGLCSSVISVVPVSFGVIIYYIINTASVYETAVTNKSLTESMLQVSYLIESLVKKFNKKTKNGSDMSEYTDLLEKAVYDIKGIVEQKGIQSLFQLGQATLLDNTASGLNDFELVSFLVVTE